MIGPLAALAFIVAQSHQPFSLKRSSFDLVTVRKVESRVMSYRVRSNYSTVSMQSLEKLRRRYDPTPAEALEDQREALPPPPKPELPIGDKLALLQLRKSEAATLIAAKLMASGAFRPDVRNFRALIPLGYAEKQTGTRWHVITLRGKSEADELIRSLAGKLNVHVYLGERNQGWQVSGHCCCGWSSTVQKGHYTSSNLAVRFDRHCETAKRMAGPKAAPQEPGKTEAT